jgi:ATP-dependent Clp protease protease subunit
MNGSDWSGGDRSGDWGKLLTQRLFEQRVVLLHGPLQDTTASRASAELMTLDAEGDGAVTLRIDSADGSLALALTLMDVIELLGVPVRALCMGQVGGPAIGVLAVCHHRAAMPSTRFSLREPTTQMESPAREVEQWARLRADERALFTGRVAAAIGKPAAIVAESFAAGVFMGADEALDYGLIDEISRPKGEIRQLPGPPVGFRPRR